MTIREILDNDKLSDNEKLLGVNEIVTNIRSNYGNSDITIDNDGVDTEDGITDIGMLSVGDKLAIAEREFNYAVRCAVVHCKCVQGTVLDKEIESAVATNSVLANLAKESGSSYI